MACLTRTGFPRTPTPPTVSAVKAYKYPQIICLKHYQVSFQKTILLKTAIKASDSSATSGSSSPGLYSSQKFELNPRNVDLVLEDVRPYLISDGGNVDVVSVENGIISLKLQGSSGLFNNYFPFSYDLFRNLRL